MSLNWTLLPVNAYSRTSASTMRWLISAPTTPTVLPLSPGTLSIDDPDCTRISATPCVMSRTVRTSDKSGMSSRTTARSTLPAAISLAASSAEPVSITFKRILEPVVASPLAMADMRRTTSSSGEPTATVRVSGRVT